VLPNGILCFGRADGKLYLQGPHLHLYLPTIREKERQWFTWSVGASACVVWAKCEVCVPAADEICFDAGERTRYHQPKTLLRTPSGLRLSV
jgi:hypothetical protein